MIDTGENATSRKRMYWPPQKRRAHSELTKARMADPAVRLRISKNTAAGMRRASKLHAELLVLRHAWESASADARREFILQVFAVCPGAAP